MTLGTRTEPVAKANDRHDLYRWKQDGVEWACCAYDHGPWCRRCQRVEDDVIAAMLDHVEDGLMVMRDSDQHGWEFQVTDEGKRRIEELVESDPEARRVFESAQLEAQFQAPDSGESQERDDG